MSVSNAGLTICLTGLLLIAAYESDTRQERIYELSDENTALRMIVDKQQSLLNKIFDEPVKQTLTLEVTVTAYSARTEETNSEPWFTADMSLSRVGMLAVSRDLLQEWGVEYGDVVILGKLGVFRVHDTMNERFTRRVDILMGNREAALRFGKRTEKLTLLRT